MHMAQQLEHLDEFLEEFCLQADDHDFCKEPIPLRFPEEPRNREFFRRPSQQDLERGYRRVRRNCQEICVPLPGLQDKHFQVVRANLTRRQDCAKVQKYWILATYRDDAMVSFTQFDFDLHPRPSETLENLADQRKRVYEQVKRLVGILRLNGVDCLVTSSPGNPHFGQHVQGIYVWVKHEPVRVADLRSQWRAWLNLHGFKDIEFCWQTQGRLVRLPGQAYMHLLDKVSLQPKYPGEGFAETFEYFMAAWSFVSPAADYELFGDLPAETPVTAVAPHEEREKPVPEIRFKGYAPIPTVDESRQEPNTFVRATKARICSRFIHQVKQGSVEKEQAVTAVKEEMKTRAPRNPDGSIRSHTCTDSELLDSTVRRWFGWYETHYDPQRTTLSPEVRAVRQKRDQEDQQRIARCLRVTGKTLARLVFRDRRFSRQQKKLIVSFIYPFVYWLKRYRGRIHCSLLEKLAGGRRQWGIIRHLLLNTVLCILDDYDQDQHKCRQWGLVAGVAGFVGVVGGGEEEKKKKRNVDEHHHDTPSSGLFLDGLQSLINAVNRRTDEILAFCDLNR